MGKAINPLGTNLEGRTLFWKYNRINESVCDTHREWT